MKMIVTTSRRNADELIDSALEYSRILQEPLIIRNDRSLSALLKEYEADLFVVSKNKLSLYPQNGGSPFFYHPNMALPRAKAYLATSYDPLVEVAGLQTGMSFLDCTLGLAADSLIASLAVGKEGRVIGIERQKAIALIVYEGLKKWTDANDQIIKAMRKIEVVAQHHYDYLKSLEDHSVDVVYFDPMFEQKLSASLGIESLKAFASIDELSVASIDEARRVAKKRVVLKDHWRSNRFSQFGFNVIIRKNTVFHYGYIDI